MFPLAIMKKTGAALAVSAAVLAGSVAPAGADFHAYDHVNFQGELTRSGPAWYIDVPDNMMSSVKNETNICLLGISTHTWVTEEHLFKLNAGQIMWYVGDHANDKVDHMYRTVCF